MSCASYTESEMGDHFAKVLNHPDRIGTKPFSGVIREFTFRQGIPDFVAWHASEKEETFIHLFADMTIPKSEVIRVLLAMPFQQSRDSGEISSASGLPLSNVRRVVSYLKEIGFVDQTRNGRYRTPWSWDRGPALDIWAFELKLRDWKRCLFQAQQCKAYATRVMAVFPEEIAYRLESIIPLFRQGKIGVMTFNHKTNDIRMLVRPMKDQPQSQLHHLLACLNLWQFSSTSHRPIKNSTPSI